MQDVELDVLIVENLADLDAAARYLSEDLEPRVGAAIDGACKSFMREVNWTGESSWDDEGTWLASPDWRVGGGSKDEFRSKVWIEPGEGAGGIEDHFWLTYLVGAGAQRIGLRWYRTDVSGKRSWRKMLATQEDTIAFIRALGFEFEEAEGTFFLPFSIDSAELAAALRDEEPERCLGGLNQALHKVLEAKAHFDALLAVVPA